MRYKLLRLLFLLAGVACVGGFAWTFWDFLQHKNEYLEPFDIEQFKRTFEISHAADANTHLRFWESYQPIYTLDYVGTLAPAAVEQAPVVKPKPRVGPEDLEVCFVQIEQGKELGWAWIRPKTAVIKPDAKIPGDFYQVGSRFPVEAKNNVEVEVLAIRLESVDLQIVEDPESKFTLLNQEFEADPASITLAAGAAVIKPQAFAETRMIQPNLFEVGSADFEKVAAMPEDEIVAAVQTRPERDPATGEIRGLRIRRIQEDSVFARQGLRAEDVVLEVNDFPVTDRAKLMEYLRGQRDVDTFYLRLERAGAVRTLTYRLPARP